MIPFEMGKQLLWDVTVVDAFAPICLNQGSLCSPEPPPMRLERVNLLYEKHRELIDNGYFFQPGALEVQGFPGESSEIFITRLCKKLCLSHDYQRAGSFLKERLSVALQIGCYEHVSWKRNFEFQLLFEFLEMMFKCYKIDNISSKVS